MKAKAAIRLTAIATFSLMVSISAQIYNWRVKTSPVNQNLRSVIGFQNGFVAAGDAGTVLYSNNMQGDTWLKGTNTNLLTIHALASKQNSVIIGVGDLGLIISSSDGKTWTKKNGNTSLALYSVVWGDTMFVAVGQNGTIVTSKDGNSWNKVTSGLQKDLISITWTGNKYVAIDSATSPVSQRIYTSTDAIHWQTVQTTIPNVLQSVAYLGSSALAVGSRGTIMYTSSSGEWIAATQGTKNFNCVINAQYQAVAIGDDQISSSYGLPYWRSSQFNIPNAKMKSIGFNQHFFAAVGALGMIAVTMEDDTKIIIVIDKEQFGASLSQTQFSSLLKCMLASFGAAPFASITVFSCNGRKVFQRQLPLENGCLTFPAGALAKGRYVMTAQTGSKQWKTAFRM